MSTSTPAPGASVAGPRRWARPVLVAAATAALMAAGTTAAHAQVLEHSDAAGDMIASTADGIQAAPNHARNDALNVTLRHSAKRVAVRVQYAELQRVGDAQGMSAIMVTNEGVRRYVDFSTSYGDWAGTAALFGRGAGSLPCAIRSKMDYANNVAAFSFPRRCLSSPRWVKFRVFSWSSEDDTWYADDDLSDELFSFDTRPVQSVRVYRAGSS
jgi:hypothetical protein